MKKLIVPLGIVTLLTVVFGTIYIAGQNILRVSANDPQIQLAQDAANDLKNGVTPASMVTGKVDVDISLSPFIMIYDKNGTLIASPAYTHEVPLRAIPLGVLKHAESNYNAVTWQPEPNVRLAAVAVKANEYYVVSARSLVEVEKRESTLLRITLLGWFIATLISLKLYWLMHVLKPKKSSK